MFNSVCLFLILEIKSHDAFTCLWSPFRLFRRYPRPSKFAHGTDPPHKLSAKIDSHSGQQQDGENLAQTGYVGTCAIQVFAENVSESRIRAGPEGGSNRVESKKADHKGKVTVFVPHYAMSGGTLIALAADEIVMDPNAVLGPVDPQIGSMPAASIVKVTELKKPAQVSDGMLVLVDNAKARVQVTAFVTRVLLKHFPQDKAVALATTLTDGRFTHDYPITVETAKGFGLPISETMPVEIYQLMDLYPQTGTGRPSVLYVQFRQTPEARPEPATLPLSPPEPPQAPGAETSKP